MLRCTAAAATRLTTAVAAASRRCRVVTPPTPSARVSTRVAQRSAPLLTRAMATSGSSEYRVGSGPWPRWTWQQTMLRVKDPKPALAFYQDVCGMTLVDKYDFPAMKFSLYFLQSLPAGASAGAGGARDGEGADWYARAATRAPGPLPAGSTAPHEPGSDAAHKYLWSTPGATAGALRAPPLTPLRNHRAATALTLHLSSSPALPAGGRVGVTLELTHNWGTETQPDFKYHPGNADRDGFGHIAFAVPDLYAAAARMDAAGVRWKLKPGEGKMKNIAFAYDADGYWVELVERAEGDGSAPYFTLAQTMLRVRDPRASVAFYRDRLGMTLLRESHYGDFSLYFLATLPAGSVARRHRRRRRADCAAARRAKGKGVNDCAARPPGAGSDVGRGEAVPAAAHLPVAHPDPGAYAQPRHGERPDVRAPQRQRGAAARLRARRLPRRRRVRGERGAGGSGRAVPEEARRRVDEGARVCT